MSIPENPKPSKSELPVGRTAGRAGTPVRTGLPVIEDAFRIVFRNLRTFISLAAIPLALSLPLGFATWLNQPMTPDDYPIEPEFNEWWYLLDISRNLLWAIFAVSWHRFVLFGRKDSTGPMQFHFRRRELRFVLYTLIFVLPMSIAGVLTPLLFGDAFYMMILAGVTVVTSVAWLCCALIFPAIAVDSDRGLGTAWRQLRGSTWLLFFVLLIVVAPFMVVGAAIAQVMSLILTDAASGDAVSLTAFILLSAAISLNGFVATAVTVSALSLAYRHLTGWSPPRSLPETEGEATP